MVGAARRVRRNTSTEAREEERRERARAETSSLLGGESEDEETAFNDYANYDDDGLIVDGRADANGLDADGAPSSASSATVASTDSPSPSHSSPLCPSSRPSRVPSRVRQTLSARSGRRRCFSSSISVIYSVDTPRRRPPEAPSGASLLHLALLRFAFIPLIAACNVTTPTWIVPVVFNHDVFAVVFILALAVTNGLLATVAVSHGARRVPPTRRQSEGVALTTALIAGIFFGSLLSLGVVFLFSGAR